MSPYGPKQIRRQGKYTSAVRSEMADDAIVITASLLKYIVLHPNIKLQLPIEHMPELKIEQNT